MLMGPKNSGFREVDPIDIGSPIQAAEICNTPEDLQKRNQTISRFKATTAATDKVQITPMMRTELSKFNVRKQTNNQKIAF